MVQKMDSSKLSEIVCRICLNHNAVLNWNDEIFELSGISYKDCYYNYTKLKETDCYPTNLCETCAYELKNAHVLFEKALESFSILQAVLTNKQLQTKYSHIHTSDTLKCEIEAFDEANTLMDAKTAIGSDGKILPLYDNERIPKIECGVNNSKETPKNEDIIIEPRHFIDINNFESPSETPLEHKLSVFCDNEDNKSSTTNKTRNKRKKHESMPGPEMDEQLSDARDSELNKFKSSKKARLRRKKPESLSETLLEQFNNNSSEQTFSEEYVGKSFQSTTKTAKKSRDKYLLMCAYCSLKVEGARKLEKHEATHNENRKRTEECPQCGVKLYTKLSLTEHMKIHDKNRKKNHKCEFCEKAFFNKGALNVHRRIHLGLMIKCQMCFKEFFRQVDLDKHLLKHSASPLQKNVGKKKYTIQCHHCNKTVLTDKWKEHIAAHLDQPQVKCKICEKNFFARSKCTKHLKQVHHKILSEYEEFIHYYVDRNKRMSSLMMKQQLSVQPLTE